MLNKNEIIEVYSNTFKKRKIANCSWIINRYCNYNCSYCWPHAHQKEKDFLTEDQYLIAVDNIIKQFNKNGFTLINWGFSGGEVTFNPHFLSILDEIQSYTDITSMYTNLVTNMSQSLKWWEKFTESTNKFKVVKVNGSWHSEYLTDQNKKNLFRDKMVFLQSSKIKVDVNYVMIPGKMDYAKTLIDFFKEKNIFVLIKGCRANYKLIDGYTKEEIKFISESSMYQNSQKRKKSVFIKTQDEELGFNSFEEMFAEHAMSYIDFNCTAGFQAITIYDNGDVCRGRTCKKEKLGNIKTGFNLHKRIQKCNISHQCTCSTDVKLPKWKDNANNMLKVG
tara:strand:+ start:84 stop:1088 length:1005 start_codon:yes stop_codon:yes gene_type:complete